MKMKYVSKKDLLRYCRFLGLNDKKKVEYVEVILNISYVRGKRAGMLKATRILGSLKRKEQIREERRKL